MVFTARIQCFHFSGRTDFSTDFYHIGTSKSSTFGTFFAPKRIKIVPGTPPAPRSEKVTPFGAPGPPQAPRITIKPDVARTGKHNKKKHYYNYFYILSIILAATTSFDAMINFIDGVFAFMAFPTMIATILLAPKVLKESNRYFKSLKKTKN